MTDSFTTWTRWVDRAGLPVDLKMPGVYALAISDADLSDQPFAWLEEVAYVGMTNSKGGLAVRLRQFDRTIARKEGHGGGCRVRYVYRDYDKLVRKLYVAVLPFSCDVASRKPADLRVKGDVAREEYVCFARYAEAHGDLPRFNRPEAPKLTAEDLAIQRTEQNAKM